MTMHNHIEQKAYPLGECDSCDVVWTAIARVPSEYFDLETEFRVASQLKEDYGMKECLFHLTDIQEKGSMVKYHLGIE